ncbi:hypothetical protein LNV23_23560 [Paucibacter sp. DJ1R-11]|uniref:hypothetical protein n=1 Tax=Paucibacter sp. DJ1R-11 TaxID=2893556 RepID=UPI0021E3D76F|nr:hypothetical protein [Paucibacter sp. DJ1R-11]MCV2366418.1 hypothetical protein [Paucibacter sp. DJ1R-11]
MHTAHQPAGHKFTSALLNTLRRTESLLELRIEAKERAEALHSLEVTESTWGAWEQAMQKWNSELVG